MKRIRVKVCTLAFSFLLTQGETQSGLLFVACCIVSSVDSDTSSLGLDHIELFLHCSCTTRLYTSMLSVVYRRHTHDVGLNPSSLYRNCSF